MTDVNQVRKAIGPLKFIFWIKAVLFASVVYSYLWDVFMESYGGGSIGLDIIGAILILYISLLMAVRLRGYAWVSLLYLVAVIEALTPIDLVSRIPYALGNKEVTSFMLAWWQIVIIIGLFDMFLISLFALWLCKDANLPDAAKQWKRTAYAFLFIYIMPKVIYLLLLQFISYRNPDREIFLDSWLLTFVVLVLMVIPLLLFHNSLKAMASGTAPADSGVTQK